MNEHLVMRDLMTIDHRRQDGDLVAPHMRRDFDLVGPMELQESFVAPTDPEVTPFLDLGLEGLGLSLFGMPIGFSAP